MPEKLVWSQLLKNLTETASVGREEKGRSQPQLRCEKYVKYKYIVCTYIHTLHTFVKCPPYRKTSTNYYSPCWFNVKISSG
jgi:hypothetical protein